MRILISRILILCVVSSIFFLFGCTVKDTYYEWFSEQKLSTKEAKGLVDDFDSAYFDVCELLESTTWYGGPDMIIYKNEKTFDMQVLCIDAWMGVVRKDGKFYCADPFDEYFDIARGFKQRHGIYAINQLADQDVENNPTQPYLVYLFGAFQSEEEMQSFERQYGVSDKNNYHTAICTGLCDVKDVLALFGVESDDETLIDDIYNLSDDFEGCAAINAGLRIKLIDDETETGFKINIYLIKLDD